MRWTTGWALVVCSAVCLLIDPAAAQASDCERERKVDLVSAIAMHSGERPDDAVDPARGGHHRPCPPFFEYERHRHSAPTDVYAVDLTDGGMGVHIGLGDGTPGWSLTFAQRHKGPGVQFELGLLYRIPRQFLLWRFYGGGGAAYSFSAGTPHAYFLTGTEFLFFFWEDGFTFETPSRRFHRSGLRFRF